MLLCQNLLEEDDNIVETDLDTNNEGYSEIALTTLTAELARLGFVMVILVSQTTGDDPPRG